MPASTNAEAVSLRKHASNRWWRLVRPNGISPRLATLLRKPFPAQAVAAMGIAKKWEGDRSAAVIAECGTGKTLISLASLHVHSNGRPFTAIVMAPGHLTLKWSKEAASRDSSTFEKADTTLMTAPCPHLHK
jgi:hypothetical protein